MNWISLSSRELVFNVGGPGLDPQPAKRAKPFGVVTTADPELQNDGTLPVRKSVQRNRGVEDLCSYSRCFQCERRNKTRRKGAQGGDFLRELVLRKERGPLSFHLQPEIRRCKQKDQNSRPTSERAAQQFQGEHEWYPLDPETGQIYQRSRVCRKQNPKFPRSVLMSLPIYPFNLRLHNLNKSEVNCSSS